MYIYTLHAYSLLIKRSLIAIVWTLEKASEEKKERHFQTLLNLFCVRLA